MQDLLEVNGIVLSSMPIGEADRRVLLLTKELGKISVFARGARKPVSPLVGVTRPFSFGTFYVYPGRTAYSLHKAEIRQYFEEIVTDVSNSLYGSYFLEFASAFSHENLPAPDLLNLLYYTLKALQKEGIPNTLVRTVFEYRTLLLEGVAPDFRTCAYCGRPLENGAFLPGIMQPVCSECGPEETLYPLSGSAVYTLNYIREAPVQRLYTFSLNRETEREIRAVIGLIVRENLEYPLKSEALLSIA